MSDVRLRASHKTRDEGQVASRGEVRRIKSQSEDREQKDERLTAAAFRG